MSAGGGGGGGAWSLRLRGPRGQTAALQIDADASVQLFCELAAEQLGLGTATDLTFRSGFPPREVTAAPAALVKDVFARNDTVVVGHAASAGKVTAAKPSAAARRSSSARGKAPAATAKRKPAEKARGVHSLHSTPARKAAPAKRKITDQGFQLGSSIDDGEAGGIGSGEEDEDGDDAAPGQPRYRRTRAIHLSSKEDVEMALANAVSGRSNDRAAKFFRAATRSAVDHQYQVNMATARLNAARGGQFEVHEVRTARRAADIARDGRGAETIEAAEMKVRFKEGARKWREETVTLLQAVELQAIVKYVLLSGGETGREMLKPFNMAQVSPRVFWSIARLYGGDIESGLAELAPDQDWSYLDIRTRIMSKKAMEAKANEEYYKLWKKRNARAESPLPSPPAQKKPRGSGSDSVKREVIEIESDEDENGSSTRQRQGSSSKSEAKRTPALSAKQAMTSALRSAAAQAALSRLGQSARTSQVVAAFAARRDRSARTQARDADETETEDEDDVEETTTVYCDACGKARMLSLDESARLGLEDSDAEWTCDKVATIGRTTGCDALDDEVLQITGAKIAALLATAAEIHTRRDLADAHVRSTVRALMDPTDASAPVVEAALSAMIDEARLDEVNDLMLELAGGDAEVVGALELQKLGTPADLLTTPTDLVVKSLRLSAPGVTLETVAEWQQQAEDAVAQRPWLREWRTL